MGMALRDMVGKFKIGETQPVAAEGTAASRSSLVAGKEEEEKIGRIAKLREQTDAMKKRTSELRKTRGTK